MKHLKISPPSAENPTGRALVDMSQNEIDNLEAQRATYQIHKKAKVWLDKMKQSDKIMSREVETLYDSYSQEDFDALPPIVKDNHAYKKSARAEKPVTEFDQYNSDKAAAIALIPTREQRRVTEEEEQAAREAAEAEAEAEA